MRHTTVCATTMPNGSIVGTESVSASSAVLAVPALSPCPCVCIEWYTREEGHSQSGDLCCTTTTPHCRVLPNVLSSGLEWPRHYLALLHYEPFNTAVVPVYSTLCHLVSIRGTFSSA